MNNTQDAHVLLGRVLMRSAPEKYEDYILAACIFDAELWGKLSKVVCRTNTDATARDINDFSSPIKYGLYLALRTYRALGAGRFMPASRAGIEYGLSNLTAIIPDCDKPAVLELYDKITTEFEPIGAAAVVRDTWLNWSTSIKTNQQLLNVKRSGNAINVMAKLDEINSLISNISNVANTEKTLFSLSELLIQEEKIVERIPLSRTFKGLNECLGGGFGKKEHTIFVVPTGRGKTTLTCQIAAEVAAAGRHVLFISTEQHPNELVPRMVSCVSYAMAHGGDGKIGFDKIKDGITPQIYANFTNKQQTVIKEFEKATNAHLHFENWKRSDKEVTDIDKLIEDVNKTLPEGECLEMVILDWIGGAITKGITEASTKRMILKNAARQMHDIADKYNVACISTVQASKDALGKRRVTEEHIADCKTLHDEAEVAFGLSAIRTKETDEVTGDKTLSYTNEQRLFCFKSRKAPGMDIPVKCNFAFQRFDAM